MRSNFQNPFQTQNTNNFSFSRPPFPHQFPTFQSPPTNTAVDYQKEQESMSNFAQKDHTPPSFARSILILF